MLIQWYATQKQLIFLSLAINQLQTDVTYKADDKVLYLWRNVNLTSATHIKGQHKTNILPKGTHAFVMFTHLVQKRSHIILQETYSLYEQICPGRGGWRIKDSIWHFFYLSSSTYLYSRCMGIGGDYCMKHYKVRKCYYLCLNVISAPL